MNSIPFKSTSLLVVLTSLITACHSAYPERESKNTEPTLQYQITSQPAYKIGQPVLLQLKLHNPTPQDIVFLKWGTPLEKTLSRNMFSVELKGKELPYRGRMVKRGKPSAKDYITIKSNQSIQREIDISKAYSFNATGKFTLKYKDSLLQLKEITNGKSLMKITTSNQSQFSITH